VGVERYPGFFETLEEVLDDIKQTGFWPTTLVSPPSPALPIHWHDSDINGYVMSGSTWVRDGESGERIEIHKGDKLVIPKGTLHAEGETTETMTYIVALREPCPFDRFLRMLPPE
jgi:mannose-6-phosphate isomerase-like protein (cupin superfamily)